MSPCAGETVANDETGLIIERNNPQALARGLVWFFEHQKKIAAMGIMARQRMIMNFSWDNYVEQTMAFYRTSLAHHNSK